MALNEQQIKIHEIFFPHYLKERNRIENGQTAFAYYTTAETAYKIIKNREIWMRNIITMNDYKEFEYGRECLKDALNSKLGDEFKKTLNNMLPNLFDDTYQNFKAWSPGIKSDTYITCFSEHDPIKNRLGRLSMWRAYGGNTGVAIIFKANSLLNANLNEIVLSSVAYFTHEEISTKLGEITSAIEQNKKFISNLDPDSVKNTLFEMFRFASLCNKHPGFEEEKEWRLVSTPMIYSSSNLKQEVEIVKGIPQKVIKLGLHDNLANNSPEFEFSALIQKIIIGPCQFPNVIFQSLCNSLTNIGVNSPHEIIEISEIPYRQPN